MEAMGPAEQMSVLQSMQSLAPLLWSAPYREPVLEGFIASIGGLDGRLRRAVSAAISQQLSGVGQLHNACLLWPESHSHKRMAVLPALLAQPTSSLQLYSAECCMLLQGSDCACFCALLLQPWLRPMAANYLFRSSMPATRH